jgi:hypothetical protein
MTDQMPDRLLHHGILYSLVAVENQWLFYPYANDLALKDIGEYGYRGYFYNYVIRGGKLFMAEMRVFPGGPRHPERHAVAHPSLALVSDLSMPIPYSGRILLADQLLADYAWGAGMEPPFAYGDVLEIVFDGGRVVRETDYSARLEQVRIALNRGYDKATEFGWMAKSFNSKYFKTQGLMR